MVKGDAVEANSSPARKISELRPDSLRVLVQKVVLTHKDGLVVYDGNHFYEAAFHPGILVGRSGRGDTCIASYMARRLEAPPSEATVWAAALTSLKMEAEGPFRRDIREVEDLIRRKYKQTISSSPKKSPT